MSLLKGIGSLLGGGFLREVNQVIDHFVTNKEEKEKLRHELIALTQSHRSRLTELANADRDSARALQKAALAQRDRFSKRFVYYLAAIWSLAGIVYVFMVTFMEIGNERTSDTVLGFLMGTIVSTIINYFFGSSSNEGRRFAEKHFSAEKHKQTD